MLELRIGITERIWHRLVKQKLFDSKKNWGPKQKVIAQPVVDEFVGVLVGHHER
jgi:hypothetical protein